MIRGINITNKNGFFYEGKAIQSERGHPCPQGALSRAKTRLQRRSNIQVTVQLRSVGAFFASLERTSGQRCPRSDLTEISGLKFLFIRNGFS